MRPLPRCRWSQCLSAGAGKPVVFPVLTERAIVVVLARGKTRSKVGEGPRCAVQPGM